VVVALIVGSCDDRLLQVAERAVDLGGRPVQGRDGAVADVAGHLPDDVVLALDLDLEAVAEEALDMLPLGVGRPDEVDRRAGPKADSAPDQTLAGGKGLAL